jgi:catechol 2,3-dioxygenase-like lactoylglutathione lyase family enzyme
MPNEEESPNVLLDIAIVGLNYASFYLKDYQEAIAFYTRVLGPPESVNEEGAIRGWRMGSTWLTLFPSTIGTHKDSNPRNAEFAIQVSTPKAVDLLHQAFVEAGAKDCWSPEDTWMYEPMRFSCVDDPFGIRVDIYCPIDQQE